MDQDVFRKRIETLFPKRLISYRELPSNKWVEFWFADNGNGTLSTYLTFAQLEKLSRLLGSTDIMVTGGDLGFSGCERCSRPDNAIYILVKGVTKFGRRGAR